MDGDGLIDPAALFRASRDGGSGGSVTLHLAGDLDIASTRQLRAVLSDAIRDSCGDVRVDLSELRFCGAAGIGVFVEAGLALRDDGRRLVLVSPAAHVEKTLRLCNVAWLLG